MNLIVLDCDGVINCKQFYIKWFENNGFNPENKDAQRQFKDLFFYHDGFEGYVVHDNLKLLNNLCEETNSMILWSSTWRIGLSMNDAKALFKAKGLPQERLIGITPNFNAGIRYTPRGLEIGDWLKNNKKKFEIDKCAILDDDETAGMLLPKLSGLQCKFFQTTWENGLTEEIKNNVILFLGKIGE